MAPVALWLASSFYNYQISSSDPAAIDKFCDLKSNLSRLQLKYVR